MRGRLDVLGTTDMTYMLLDSPLSADNRLNDLVKFTDFTDSTQNFKLDDYMPFTCPRLSSVATDINGDRRTQTTTMGCYSVQIKEDVDLQAVEFADGAVCAVFHKAGRLGDFETDTPCVFILENDRMYLADPTHLVKTMKFSFRGQTYMLTVPDGLMAGSTVPIGISHP